MSVPALYKRPESRTRREFSSQLMAAGFDSLDKGHATLRLISAAGTRTPSIHQPCLLHRCAGNLRITELGAQTWGLKQVTNVLTCKTDIILLPPGVILEVKLCKCMNAKCLFHGRCFIYDCGLQPSVVLLPQGIWQCLETFGVSQQEGGGCYWHLMGEDQRCY